MLVDNYSSDEDTDVSKDLFGLALLPPTKKPRVDLQTQTVLSAAPDVLAEARVYQFVRLKANSSLGSIEPNIVGH